MKKIFLSILLSLCMVLMLCPVTAFADDEPTVDFTINGPDEICVHQDYEFTVTASTEVDWEKIECRLYLDTVNSIFLSLTEKDGVMCGVVSAGIYQTSQDHFSLEIGYIEEDPVDGTTFVLLRHKDVYFSFDHIYEAGVCGCGAKQQYTVTYDGGADFGLMVDVKTHGEELTLLGKTFTRDGYVQTGWMDEYYNEYELGGDYTLDEDMTFYPIFEKLVTVTADFTTTVALGDAGEPGETTFELGLIDDWGDALTDDNVTVTAAVTTDGGGDYAGTMTITGPEQTLWYMLSEGAFVQQVDAGADGWTVDDTVWGLFMSQAADLMDDAAPGYAVYVVPASIDGKGNYYIDWENLQTADMCFTNTYTAHVYELNHDADGHWDECDCGDIQNPEPHKYGDWKVTKEATETEKGEQEHTCTVCGYTETAEISKLPATDTDDPKDTDDSKDTTNPKKSNPDTGATTSPQTGDNSNLSLWIALLFAGGFGMIGTGVYNKRRRSSRKK